MNHAGYPMRRLMAVLLLALGLAGPAIGGEAVQRMLVTGDDSRGWQAVGRLELGGRGFCTASLVAPGLVLTAAHCLFDQTSGAALDPGTLRFMAGWRDGRAAAYRGVRRVAVHPGFSFSDGDRQRRGEHDLALVELDQPIRLSAISPFELSSAPGTGGHVGVVSYAMGRADTPALEERCGVLGRQGDAMVLSCSVDFGSSGAPVFVTEGGVARIVSVVTAKALVGQIAVSVATSIGEKIADLTAILAASDGVFTRAGPEVRTVSQAEAQAATGAKFIRP